MSVEYGAGAISKPESLHVNFHNWLFLLALAHSHASIPMKICNAFNPQCFDQVQYRQKEQEAVQVIRHAPCGLHAK